MPLPFTYFVKTTPVSGTPTDTLTGIAPGRDPIGVGLVNATYDHTGGASEQLLTASGTPFTNVIAGDYIFLSSVASGIADGCYEISAVNDTASIVLSVDSGLTGDSTADVDSSVGPWLTLQYAFDNTLTTGDQLVICDDGNGTGTHWEVSGTLDLDTNTGGVNSIILRGGSSRGVVDGTQAVLSGASHVGTVDIITTTSTVSDIQLIDLRLTGSNRHGINVPASSQGICYLRCRFDNCTETGLYHRGTYGTLVDCEIDNNSGWGYLPGGTSNSHSGISGFTRCSIHDNTSGGAYLTSVGGSYMIQCLVYDNGGPGVQIYRGPGADFEGCIFFGNTGDGIESGSATWSASRTSLLTAHNCIFRSNGGYGIDWGYNHLWTEIDYCCFHNNTSGATRGVINASLGIGSVLGGDHNIYSDPLFTSETDGSEDFNLQDGSPCINAGIEPV